MNCKVCVGIKLKEEIVSSWWEFSMLMPVDKRSEIQFLKLPKTFNSEEDLVAHGINSYVRAKKLPETLRVKSLLWKCPPIFHS